MAEFIFDDIDFASYLKDTDAKTKVLPAASFVQDAKDRLRTRARAKRTYLPWPKCNESFEFRKGEVTVWAGQNGHGKTDVTTQVAVSLVGQGEKVCVASFEMKPVTTVGRMVRMYNMTNPFSEEYQGIEGLRALDSLYDEFGEWTTNKLWLYDQTGTARPDTVLGMVKYCANELGITHIFIDSLMKCVRAEDDYNGQKDFVDKLGDFAKRYSVHVALVHHMRKPKDENEPGSKMDAKGTGAITDMVDTVAVWWRNKPKEHAVKAAQMKGVEPDPEIAGKPDGLLIFGKQRNGEEEPTYALWFDQPSMQFLGRADHRPHQFVGFSSIAGRGDA